MKQIFTLSMLLMTALVVNAQCFISEIHYDNAGTDAGEAVEITCPSGTDISAYKIIHYNGSNGGVLFTHDVPAGTVIANQGDVICTGSPVASGTYFIPIAPMQNDVEGVALINAMGAVVEFVSYEGSFTATAGPANGSTSVNIGVTEGSSTPVGASLKKGCTGWLPASPNNFGFINLALPVKFSEFNIKNKGNANLVSFSTLSELNNDFFEIERSADGFEFEVIGKIKGAGLSSREVFYTYADEKPVSGVNYYRIKQVDYDGQSEYSEVKSIVASQSNTVITPRSTYDIVDIRTEAAIYGVSIYNTTGQLVLQMDQLTGTKSVDLSSFVNGVYIVNVITGNQKESFKITKL
jgi:hypothetical protein